MVCFLTAIVGFLSAGKTGAHHSVSCLLSSRMWCLLSCDWLWTRAQAFLCGNGEGEQGFSGRASYFQHLHAGTTITASQGDVGILCEA